MIRKVIAKAGYRLYMWGVQPQLSDHDRLVLLLRFHRAWCARFGVDFRAAVADAEGVQG